MQQQAERQHSASKRICMNAADCGTTGSYGVFFPSSPQIDIPAYRFGHGDLAAVIVDPIQQVTLNNFFLLPQFLRRGSIDIAPFLVAVPVTAIKTSLIGTLILA